MRTRSAEVAAPAVPFRLPEQPVPVDVMAKYFRAFGDPTRLRILQLLVETERSVGELVAATGQSQPKISNHLACLRWCGFVHARREHRSVYYSIADDRIRGMLRLAEELLERNAQHVACCGVLAREA
jgi:ArsR family transcriptional regulator, cadmium/lead-responsive transcriptional repressor